MSLLSPVARAMSQGAAHEGAGHWWVQRVTALALAPLAIWLLVRLLALPDFDWATVTAWIAAGWNPVLLSLTVLIGAWHSWLGLQVVIEDYVHSFAWKATALLLSVFVHALIAASAIYAVLRVALRSVG